MEGCDSLSGGLSADLEDLVCNVAARIPLNDSTGWATVGSTTYDDEEEFCALRKLTIDSRLMGKSPSPCFIEIRRSRSDSLDSGYSSDGSVGEEGGDEYKEEQKDELPLRSPQTLLLRLESSSKEVRCRDFSLSLVPPSHTKSSGRRAKAT